MAVSESVHAAWRHGFHKNRPDATGLQLSGQNGDEMNADEPLDFSLKKRPRTDDTRGNEMQPAGVDWKGRGLDNQLLRSCLEGTKSAFDVVAASRSPPVMPISPFLASLLRTSDETYAPPAKNVRPFKAYNPLDPVSALNLGCFGGLSMLSSAAPDLSSLRDVPSLGCRPSALINQHRNNSNQLPRSQSGHSVVRGASLSEVSSSTATPPGPPGAMDLSPTAPITAPVRDNSNSPTSTSDMSGSKAPKRDLSPSTRSGCGSPHRRSESGNSSDASGPTSAGVSQPDPLALGSSGSARSRRRGQSMPDELKDDSYWERRRKNNEAAKRSRDTRRAKEDEIAMRAAFLEQENIKLRIEVAALRSETDKLRHLLLNS